MIDLYYWPTPNGQKKTMFLEEAALDYTIHPINISARLCPGRTLFRSTSRDGGGQEAAVRPDGGKRCQSVIGATE